MGSVSVNLTAGNALIYFNDNAVFLGEKSIDEVGEEAFQMLLDTLNGRMTKNEALSYFGSVDIFCLGPVI